MARNGRLEFLHMEQNEILAATDRMEDALELAGEEDFSKRVKRLIELRALDQALNGIAEHFHSEERIVESTFRRYSSRQEHSQVAAEHTELLRLLYNFREELEFATADSAADIIPSGKELIRKIREHIRFAKKLLERIESEGPVPEEILLRYTESPE